MNCLNDYIGIKSGGSNPPLSGIYINQLPGFTLDKISKITESENGSLTDLWGEVQNRSWTKLEKDLRIALRKRYKLSAIKSSAVVKPLIDNLQTVPAAQDYRGIVIDIGNFLYDSFFNDPAHTNEPFLDLNRSKGSFLGVYVDSISITLPAAVSGLVVKIFDGSGVELKSITVANAVSGLNKISVLETFLTQHIFIAIDAENTSLYSSSIPKDVLESCYAFVMAFCNSCKPSIYGAQSAKATPGSIEKTDNTFSIEAAYSVRCDFNNIICNNKAEFSDVWLYLLGSELMLENMYSTRLNRWTTIDKERATELKEYYAQEYEKALTETISGLEISQEDCCIECNPQIAYRERTP